MNPANKTPTKYAEWVNLPCGKCRVLVDIGTVLEHERDPECIDHRLDTCLICGVETERGTVAHGTFGESTHTPKFGEIGDDTR